MPKSIYINVLAFLFTVISLPAQAEESTQQMDESVLLKDMGYFYGYSFGNMLRDGASDDVDLDSLMQGLKDSLQGTPPSFDDTQRDAIYAEVRKRQAAAQAAQAVQQEAQQQVALEQAGAHLKAGVAYLTENASRETVKVTASGLQYEVLEEKEGPTAKATDTVVVYYRGTFMDGQVFDQSGDSPVEFGLQQVISGWTEGLQLMSAGDRYRLHLHPDLAYGAGSVGQIPPNSVLIFDIELLEVK